MKTPAFWYQPAGCLSWLLWPVGWLYGLVTSWRMGRPSISLGIPVVCVGNFTAGGAGKTPTTIAIVRLLQEMGEKPFVVSRGYGGQIAGPTLVDPAVHRTGDCGDEPLLLARHAPTVVAKDKVSGARFALAAGATVVVLDDGLQNAALKKDLTICVMDGAVGIGNGFCIPAGPLRAPLLNQLGYVDVVIVTGDGAVDGWISAVVESQGKALIAARLVPDETDVMALAGKQLLAFAGIGRPEKFFATLRNAGLEVVETRTFADHHVFRASELERLASQATASGLTLVTTQKDAVRIGSHLPECAVLAVSLETDRAMIKELLQKHMGENRVQLKTSHLAP